MDKANKVSVSAALIVVVCFFLPWVQVSCGATRDSMAGLDLAREGHNSLWLIPLLMIVAIGARFVRSTSRIDFSPLIAFIAGVISAYLMNQERIRAEDSSGLLAIRVTGWFWLGLAASIVVAVAGAIQFVRHPKPS